MQNKISLLFTCVLCLLLTSCQSASSDAVDEVANAETIVMPPVTTGYRYDQSLIQANNNQIWTPETEGRLNRSIPDISDSRVSYCESVNGQAGQYNGVRDLKKYPLASLSKIFLSAWALDKLGPDYKFENLWYLKKVAGTTVTYDAYFRANYDPAINIEKMLYAISNLNAQGVHKIRRLVIDESTRVYLSVLNDPHVELSEVPVSVNQSVDNLKIILNSSNWGSQTEAAKVNLSLFAQDKNRTIVIPKSFSVEEVVYLPKSQINVNEYNFIVKMRSAILLKYLKDINVNSNNYMSDTLFKILGGSQEFKKFQRTRLNIQDSDLAFYTGSGLPIVGMGLRQDNLGTCHSVLKTLKFIKNLSDQLGFDMGHVLLTAGVDDGTYEASMTVSFNQSMAIKTGRLFDVPALNVAGTASLKQGALYFAYMAHDFNNEDEFEYKKKRDRILNSILNYYPVQPSYKSLKSSLLLAD